MNLKRIMFLLAVVAVLPLASCSGLKTGCSTGCTTGNANVTISLYDTPPAGVSVLSFTLPIAGISLTPSGTTTTPVSVTTTVPSVEATRLQTDSAVIASAASVAAGTYTALNVTLAASSGVFINTNPNKSTITWTGGSCIYGAVCNLPSGAATTVSIPLTLTLTESQNQWIGLDLNLNNAITTANGTTIGVDFTQPKTFSVTTTPRTGIPSSTADTIEDFVGVVTAYTSGSSITVQSGISGQKITAVLNSSTAYDTQLNNTYNKCTATTAQACIALGSTVSLDASLSVNGTLTATEVDVLDSKAVDEVEGIIYPTSNGATCPAGSCFGLILADKALAATGGSAVLAATTTTYGTGFFLTFSPTAGFVIDSKTLSTAPTFTPIGFASATDILSGQQVRVQVTNVTSGASGIQATGTNVALRFSRMTGAPSNAAAGIFNFTPPTFVTTLSTGLLPAPLAYTYSTTAFDGITDASGISGASTVSIRTLFLNNTQPTFAVAKVRVP